MPPNSRVRAGGGVDEVGSPKSANRRRRWCGQARALQRGLARIAPLLLMPPNSHIRAGRQCGRGREPEIRGPAAVRAAGGARAAPGPGSHRSPLLILPNSHIRAGRQLRSEPGGWGEPNVARGGGKREGRRGGHAQLRNQTGAGGGRVVGGNYGRVLIGSWIVAYRLNPVFFSEMPRPVMFGNVLQCQQLIAGMPDGHQRRQRLAAMPGIGSWGKQDPSDARYGYPENFAKGSLGIPGPFRETVASAGVTVKEAVALGGTSSSPGGVGVVISLAGGSIEGEGGDSRPRSNSRVARPVLRAGTPSPPLSEEFFGGFSCFARCGDGLGLKGSAPRLSLFTWVRANFAPICAPHRMH
ncbi:hypothetical protein B0H14DRAFT_2589021 [Mycena olivaceomarginata]|nr:hypothetical protein B0H14DRAFT_2589021 [Mycena olivaceomarginata]